MTKFELSHKNLVMDDIVFLKLAVFDTDLFKPPSKGKSRDRSIQALCELFQLSEYYRMEFGRKEFDGLYKYPRDFYGTTVALGYTTDDLSEMRISAVKYFCTVQNFVWRGFATIPLSGNPPEISPYEIRQVLQKKNLV